MKQEVRYLLEIIKYILNRKQGEMVVPAKDMDWERFIQLAREHSILNCVYYGVDALAQEHKPDEAKCDILYKALVNSVVRNYNQIEGVKELFEAFEEEGIYALAVKGICTKQHYPQTDMRTMGDIDILYQPQQDAKVRKVMKQLGYDQSVEGRKHDCYFRRPYLAVEMHRDLVEADSAYTPYYATIWERVKPKENCQYIREMTLEDEYIYTLVHLARHFQDGGIGIRFVIDVYVYNHLKGMDWKYVESQLKKLQLWKFYGNISKLSEMWFGEEMPSQEENALLDKLATYIIANGTFGSARNAAAVSAAEKGKFQALRNEIFPSLQSMQSMFVWLDKWPILLPYGWMLRGVRSVTSKRRRMNIKYHVDKYKNSDKKYGEELQRFFEACGLLKTEKNIEDYKNRLEVDFLLQVIKYVLNSEKGVLPLPEKKMDWEQLFKIARCHNLLNILYYGVSSLPPEYRPNEKRYQYLQEAAMYELVVSYNQTEEAKELLNKFEESGIYVVAVKGVRTKRHYPQPDMRSMGDIDILYKEHQQKKLKETMKCLEFQEPVEGRVHDAYARPPYINLEAHRKLVSADSKYSWYYEDIWDKLSPQQDCRYVHEMSLEDEYIYTIVHLAGHFQNGGIGIRFVMDVYVYNQMSNMNWEYVETELKKLKLWEFYQNISRLAERWFGTKKISSEQDKKIVDKLSEYIVSNGTFGSQKNSAAVSVAKVGRVKFILKAIFPDYKSMQSMFPWLRKCPILLPYSWGVRGIRSIIFRRGSIKIQVDKYRYGDKKYGKELEGFFEKCGL